MIAVAPRRCQRQLRESLRRHQPGRRPIGRSEHRDPVGDGAALCPTTSVFPTRSPNAQTCGSGRHAGRDRPYLACHTIVDDVHQHEWRYARNVFQRLDRDEMPRDARGDERVDHDRVPARVGLRRDECATVGVAYVQAGSAPQSEVRASERDHICVDLTDLLASVGILSGQRPRKRTGTAANVHDPPGTGRAQRKPQPTHVAKLKVRRVSEIDVGGVHAAGA